MKQRNKILAHMAKDPSKWYYPQDFMPPRMSMDNEYFVGYEASARLSELASEYPDMIETKQDGKYKCRRFNLRGYDYWYKLLPKELQEIVVSVKPKEQSAVSWLKD